MKPIHAPAAALAIVAFAVPAVSERAVAAPIATQDTTIASAFQALQRMAIQYGVLVARSFVDLTYDNIAVEPGTGDIILTGLRLYPDLTWDEEGACEITVDRLMMASANGLDRLGSALSLDDVTIPPACLQPDVADTLAGFGYDGLTIDSAAIDTEYDIPSSSADMVVSAAVADAADISLTAQFDYVWFRLPVIDSSDPEAAAADAVPVARLGSAELVVENRGLWQALEPMLAEQMGDLSAIPQMVEMMLGGALSQGGERTPTPEETAFVDQLTAEVARFIENKDRLVITAAPEDGSVLLTEELMSSPEALIAALDPVVSSVPAAYRAMISPADLAAAMGGGDLDDATRLRVGEALVTGVGAPRSVETGRTLLAPLADRWDARAALLSARADRAAGDMQAAYAMALRAMAGGEAAAIGLADELEAEMPLVAVLSAQAEAAAGRPGADQAGAEADALVANGDIAGMRRRANAAATGRNRPRDYAEAYYWASLAAAAGDRGADVLRDRLDTRFAGQEGWRETAAAEATKALETWTGGLAETIAARVQ